jgi:hypothetical protein
MKRFKHPLLFKFDIHTKANIMCQLLERQAHDLRSNGYNPKPAVQWLNEILPLVRQMEYGHDPGSHRNLPDAELEIQAHWEEFILLFLDEIPV